MSLMSTRQHTAKPVSKVKKKKTARHDKYLYVYYTLYCYYCVLVKKKYSDVDICNFYARHTCVCVCGENIIRRAAEHTTRVHKSMSQNGI